MKLIIESEGTLKGTKLDFQMNADEVQKMADRHRRRKMRLKRAQPPDISVDPSLQKDDIVGLTRPWTMPNS